jgi:hypothetical protein
MKTKLFSSPGAAIIGFALAASQAAAQVYRSGANRYDEGTQPNLAIHPSGLVLEFHRTNSLSSNTLRYHVGRVEGTSVSWGGSQRAPSNGSWPTVAITSDGLVLFVWSTGGSGVSMEIDRKELSSSERKNL